MQAEMVVDVVRKIMKTSGQLCQKVYSFHKQEVYKPSTECDLTNQIKSHSC